MEYKLSQTIHSNYLKIGPTFLNHFLEAQTLKKYCAWLVKICVGLEY